MIVPPSQALRHAAQAALVQPPNVWDRDAAGTRPYIVEFQGRSVHRIGPGNLENIRIGKEAFSVVADATSRNDLLRRKNWFTCNWSTLLVDEDCTEEAVRRFLLQTDRFVWAQLRVQQLLRESLTMPPLSPQTALAWANWTREVYRHVSLAYWTTNIRATWQEVPLEVAEAEGIPGKFPRSWLAWDGPRVDRWREEVRGASREARGASRRTLADQVWDSGARFRDEPFMPGFDRLPSMDPGRSWLQADDGAPMPRFWSDIGGIVFLPGTRNADGSLAPSQFARWEEFYPTNRDSFDAFDDASFQQLVELYSDGAPDLVKVIETPSQAEQNAGRRRTRPFASAEEEAAWNARTRTVKLTGRAVLSYVGAIAEDLVLGSYLGIVFESLDRWRTSVNLLPEYARTGDTSRAIEAVTEAQRANGAIARQRIEMARAVTGVVANIVASGVGEKAAAQGPPLNAIVDLIYGIVSFAGGDDQAVLGGSSVPFCSPTPFMRQMSQPECNSSSMLDRLSAMARRTDQQIVAASSNLPLILLGVGAVASAAGLAFYFTRRK